MYRQYHMAEQGNHLVITEKRQQGYHHHISKELQSIRTELLCDSCALKAGTPVSISLAQKLRDVGDVWLDDSRTGAKAGTAY
eukprot:6184839-Pleurochrysis_carterae.AAC.6